MKRFLLALGISFALCFSAVAQFNGCSTGVCPSTFGSGIGPEGGIGGGGGLVPHLGFVATRAAVPNSLITANKQFNSRTSHTMNSSVSSFQVVFPNWYVTSSFVEAGSGAAATLTAAIEVCPCSPTGTITQITFSGSATGTIPSGGNLTSDSIALPLASGTQFFIRTFYNNTAGVIALYDGNTGVAADFEANNYTGEAINAVASGATDLTLGGTITDNASLEAAYRPVAIIGMTTKDGILILGDSRQQGYQNNQGSGNPLNVPQGEWTGSVEPYVGYLNAGVSKDQANQFVVSHTNRAALAQYATVIGFEYGINDLDLSNYTSTQLLASVQSIINLFPGKPFYISTLDPNSSPSNTAPASTTIDAQRVAYNTVLRNGTSGLTGLTGVFDIASITENSLNGGLWGGGGISSDFLHPNSIGYPAITASGIVSAALMFPALNLPGPPPITANTCTGGLRTTSGSNTIIKFTSNRSFVCPNSFTASYLNVAGGAGAGTTANGGGGGGGGVLPGTTTIASGTTAITVGLGGAPGANGGNSVIGALTPAIGGGAGASGGNVNTAGGAGGSGGGAGNGTGVGGAGTVGQGNTGGAAGNDAGPFFAAGAGGGAGAAAVTSTAGAGILSSITGTPTYYGGGGGGATSSGTSPGGIGGGGAGGTPSGPVAGTPNTGGGGGGTGTSGGSGVIILSCPTGLC
jgi:hypothetical protein